MSSLTKEEISAFRAAERQAEEFDTRVATKIFRAKKTIQPEFPQDSPHWFVEKTDGSLVYLSVHLTDLSGVDYRGNCLPCFSHSAAADLAVLREVQQNWLEGRRFDFAMALEGIYLRRAHKQRIHIDTQAAACMLVSLYEVGDYSKAALIVIPDD